MKGRDAEGRGIFVFNVGNIDVKKAPLEKYQKMGAYLMEVRNDDGVKWNTSSMHVNLLLVSPLFFS